MCKMKKAAGANRSARAQASSHYLLEVVSGTLKRRHLLPLFRVMTRLAHDVNASRPYKWSYTWYTDDMAPQGAAQQGVTAWTTYLRNFHRVNCYCYQVYASSVLEGDINFSMAAPVSNMRRGALGNEGDPLPNFTTLRIDLNVDGSRPSRKFLRIPLGAQDVESGVFTNTTLGTAILANMQGMLDTQEWVDPQGSLLTGVTLFGITSRRVGRDAYNDVPVGPAIG